MQIKHTHCDRRPSCEIVSKILSAKLVQETWVEMPLTVPFASFEGAGKGSSRTSFDAADAIVGLSFWAWGWAGVRLEQAKTSRRSMLMDDSEFDDRLLRP